MRRHDAPNSLSSFALRFLPPTIHRRRLAAAFLAPTLRAALFFAAFALRFAAPTLRPTLARVFLTLRFAPPTLAPVARFAFDTFAFTLRFAAPRFAARFRVLVAIPVSL